MNAEEVLTEQRATREEEAAAHHARVDRILAAFPIAFTALYTAGQAGNVTCRTAIHAVEAILQPAQG